MDRLITLSLVFCFVSCAVFVPADLAETDQFVFHDPAAGKVQLIGDWNNWGGLTSSMELVNPSVGVMQNENGIWTIASPDDLEKGRYRYAFLVNGVQFFPDPINPERTNFLEHEVSVFIVD